MAGIKNPVFSCKLVRVVLHYWSTNSNSDCLGHQIVFVGFLSDAFWSFYFLEREPVILHHALIYLNIFICISIPSFLPSSLPPLSYLFLFSTVLLSTYISIFLSFCLPHVDPYASIFVQISQNISITTDSFPNSCEGALNCALKGLTGGIICRFVYLLWLTGALLKM